MMKALLLAFLLWPFAAMADMGVTADAIILLHNHPMVAVLGLLLILVEFMAPTKGILGIIGMILFVIGTFSLADHPNPALRLSLITVILMNIIVVGTMAFIAYRTVRGYTKDDQPGTLINQQGRVIDWNEKSKRVEVGGTVWQAESAEGENFQPGNIILVVGQDNLKLIVKGK